MVPVDEHGASSSTASNVCSGVHARHIGADEFGIERQPGEIFAHAVQPRLGPIDRGDEGAGRGQLRGLAAGRGAQIGDAAPGKIAEQPCRQRRRGVLNPPCAFGKTRQRRHRAMRDGAHGAGRQHAAVEVRGPRLRIALHRQVERRLMAVGGRDGARGRLAVGLDPARQQPAGRIENDRIERGEALGAFARHAPQHRIDEAGEVHGLAGSSAPIAPTDRPRRDRGFAERGFAPRQGAAPSPRAAPAPADRVPEKAR